MEVPVLRFLMKMVVIACTLSSGAATAAPVSLFHSFSLGSANVWEPESFALSTDGWRVGSIGGSVASDVLMAQVLGALTGFEVRARCANGDSGGGVFSFCGMDLSNVNLANLVTDNFSQDSAGWQQAAGGNPPFDADWSGSGGDPDGFVSVTNTALDAVLTDIALIAPSKYLGDQSAAFGQALTFSLRGFDDGISLFGLQSPYVLLVADIPTDPNLAPEPSTWVLLAGSLGAMSWVRRRLPNR